MTAIKAKFTLQRVRLNKGGYNSRGHYYGHGQPLYWYMSEDGKYDGYVRALTRVAAKQKLRADYGPAIRFYV
jgi:hypothetical protein